MRTSVVAHANKSVGGGLPALRDELRRRGETELTWYEVSKSRFIPDALAKALRDEPELVLLWGGDGTVQKALDTVSRSSTPHVPLGVIPAGTSNLFAANLGIPQEISGALDVAFGGLRRVLDVGSFNGERFGVMAGVGFDALMIEDASGALKNRLGRAAYVWTGARNLRKAKVRARVRVDGKRWFEGRTSCVLVANVGDLFGGVTLFERADPADGRLDVAVLHTETLRDWGRLAGRVLSGKVAESPLISTATGKRVDIELDRKMRVELDGGAGGTTKHVKVRVKKAAVTVCVPQPGDG
jgi:YegS/Rv2252/BmrU family lipid kinase